MDDLKILIEFIKASSFDNNDSIAYIYDGKWRIGKVQDKSEEGNDILVHFFIHQDQQPHLNYQNIIVY